MYTKGNWRANSGVIYVEETDASVCYVAFYGEDDNEAEDNARLIAAAPDLLKACEAICEELPGGTLDLPYQIWDQLQAAIAKAKY